jgi:cytoskeletal protein CcmA (bactofilin family)
MNETAFWRRPDVSDVNTLVGRGSHFEGKMTFEGTVRVDGSFSGEIVSDDTLIIGETAEVRAELDVATVIIYGTVYGNIHATGSIQLKPDSHLVGNIVTPSLIVEPGSAFDGSCRMGAVDWVQDEEASADSGEAEEGEAQDVTELMELVRSEA